MSDTEITSLKAQLDRVETKQDVQGQHIGDLRTDVAVIKTQLEPINRLMWALITGGVLAFLTSIASLVLAVKGK